MSTGRPPQHDRVGHRPADNPFASHRIERLRYRLQGTSWPVLDARLAKLGGRGAVVGPKGSGKTTLLEELAARHGRGAVLLRLPGSCPDPLRCAFDQLPDPLPPGLAVFLDSAEQLGPWAWRRLRRRLQEAPVLVITAHRAGRLPTLLDCRTSLGLLEDLVAELAPPADLAALGPRLEPLFAHFKGDIRRCLRALYDLNADRNPAP